MKEKSIPFIALVLTLLSYLPLQAEHVNVEKAEKTARSYARTKPRLTARKNFHLSRTISRPVMRNHPGLRNAQQEEEPMYYVFTMNDEGGFIVVSGDDVAKPVLAYSDEGTFDESNPNLSYWMETLAQEIAGAIENNVSQDPKTKEAWATFDSETTAPVPLRSSGDYIDPLVKTKWNQGAPYNNLCPMISDKRTVTGCVATAMAQIMKYHDHPTSRTVTIPGYTTGNVNIPAIDGITNYDWNNMSNTYTTSSTGAPANAVATLMYHCGVSVEMNYQTSGSGAYSSDVVPALKTYFGYDAGITYRDRNYYTYADWINLLKTEIRANRPVYYGGNGSGGGHAFVCDGYDTDDLFHFNWGWGGSSDGYFEVSALNPNAIGTGGGSGGYNYDQEIITGIQPSTGSVEQSVIQLGLSTVSADKASLTTLTESFSVKATKLMNIGDITIESAYLGVLLCNQDGSYRNHQTLKKTMGLP
ncbi:MAG: C10 family peptidase, partial [Dysgonamonadaceae bacterium]|nr:C10 family peptidase [Dysgonamonadaceae bacterium]